MGEAWRIFKGIDSKADTKNLWSLIVFGVLAINISPLRGYFFKKLTCYVFLFSVEQSLFLSVKSV
ncbi:MAG: hypothetical protein HW390_1244 [Candidatus Brocadiaceae bacterium]|nr:hypothetical protein [Candidatus Brocadiaceae bacterium]